MWTYGGRWFERSIWRLSDALTAFWDLWVKLLLYTIGEHKMNTKVMLKEKEWTQQHVWFEEIWGEESRRGKRNKGKKMNFMSN